VTKWYTDGDGFTDEIKGWEDEKRLYLSFSVNHDDGVMPLAADEVVRCFACLNV